MNTPATWIKLVSFMGREFWCLMSEEAGLPKKKKCPFCAELILDEAIKCRFCQSDLRPQAPAAGSSVPGFAKAAIFNVVCPGLGAWKLGHKARGGIVFLAVIGFLLIYAYQVIPLINEKVAFVVKTGQTRVFNELTKDLEANPWLDLSFYAYLLSFVDLYFLASNSVARSGSKVDHATKKV